MKFFMGLKKSAPNAAVEGDMGWTPPSVKLWGSTMRLYARMNCLSRTQLTSRIFNWTKEQAQKNKNNWIKRLRNKLKSLELSELDEISNGLYIKQTVKKVREAVYAQHVEAWKQTISCADSKTGKGGNKLRHYCTFKTEFATESYITERMPRRHRQALSMFRCGVAPHAVSYAL